MNKGRTCLVWFPIAFGMGLLWLLSGSHRRIETNISPLARVVFDGDARYLNPSARMELSLPEAATDGLYDTLYMAEFDVGEGERSLELRFPFHVQSTRIVVLGWDKQGPTTMRVAAQDERGEWRTLREGAWASRGETPPLWQIDRPGRCRALRLTFRDVDRVVLNSVMCFAAVPRWLAWSFFVGLNLIGPWLVGTAVVLATLGWGRIVLGAAGQGQSGLGQQTVAGVAFVAALAVIWCLTPRHAVLTVAVLVGCLGVAGLEAARWLKSNNAGPDHGLVPWLLLTTLLLLCEVMVDTYLVANRRIIPVDHLLSYLGSKRLVGRVPMTEDLTFRPWLVHGLFAPLDWGSGRFSYWSYLGFMAGLNSLVLVPVALFSRRWRPSSERSVVALVALLPIMGCFHFLGQRPLAAGLVLIAVYWWTDAAHDRRWSGLALSLAILAHPSSLFVLPGGVLYWLFRPAGGWASGVRDVVRGVWMPCVVYLLWTTFIHWYYPGVRNDLMLYPIKTHIAQGFGAERSVWEIVRSLSRDHWLELALNRFAQVRHYFWTDSLGHPVIDVFRWISLPNVLGFVLSFALVWPSVWKRDRAFLWLSLGGPLLMHHFFVGQPHGFFHFAPTPFFALALLVSVAVRREPTSASRIVLGISLVEIALRRLYPSVLAYLYPADVFCFFGEDQVSYVTLSLLHPLVWCICVLVALRADRGSATNQGTGPSVLPSQGRRVRLLSRSK